VRAWLRWLEESGRTRVAVALLREFFAAYPEETTAFDELRRALQTARARGDSPRVLRWRDRCERFRLLELDGPAHLARLWWDVDAPFDEFLDEAGLGPGLETSEFVGRVTEQMLDAVQTALEDNTATVASCQRAVAWLEKAGKLRFDTLRVQTAAAFLEPFLERNPEAPIQASIQSFLCRTIGDPRIDRRRWHGVPDRIRNVLFRWLVSVSLEDFFRALDATAMDQHWRYRKAFWSAYLQREAISDAWVVLGAQAARLIRRGVGTEGVAAGRLRAGGGVQSNQSVLLMRIGGLTIAEWSHNGTCRVWDAGNRTAPRLYEVEYRRDQLIDGCAWDQRHDGSPEGRWQAHVANHIARETGIRVTHGEYMPSVNRGRSWR
jgi:hypothetical protein